MVLSWKKVQNLAVFTIIMQLQELANLVKLSPQEITAAIRIWLYKIECDL